MLFADESARLAAGPHYLHFSERAVCAAMSVVRQHRLTAQGLAVAQDADGATAAQLAAAGGHVEVVARLLDAGNSRGDKGLTALHLAAQAGSQPLVTALLALPALDVNATDTDGMTALHWAASKGAHHHALDRCGHSPAASDERHAAGSHSDVS